MINHQQNTTKSQKADFWQNHIDQCLQSSMSQRDYCRLNNLALSTFGYWKRRTTKESENKIQFYPLIVPDTLKKLPGTGLVLKLDNDRFRIEVAEHFSTSALKKLIIALEQL